MEGHMHTGTHDVVHWLGMSFNLDTIIATYIVFAIIIGVMFVVTRNVKMIPGPLQNGIEFILEGLSSQFKTSLGKRTDEMSSILFTFFFFILVSNQIGLLPNPHILISPTSDINTTAALALATMVIVWFMGIKIKGIGFFKHFFQPFKVFVIINVVEELAKPITLAFRLFGNIMAGELLLELLYKLVPWGTPIIWLAFSIFVGIIQAFIFTLLTASYIGMATSEEH